MSVKIPQYAEMIKNHQEQQVLSKIAVVVAYARNTRIDCASKNFRFRKLELESELI